MASDDTFPQSRPPGSGPGSNPSASNYLPDLPLAEDLQTLLEGRYIVESFLGQGGMGAVYKGLQMPLRRPVAIKILQKKQAGAEEDEFAFEERFKREAYAMAALTHPHIVQVYDCGDAGRNFLFISMELVEGGDLSDAIKAGSVTPEVALKLIPQICDGLQAAHERGIVHRDIKPANIFLTKDGRAKVADFGLAKKFDARNTLVTKAGLGMGTPDYAAPEQFDGVEDIDHRADIYSLGVMMYQMLTGRLPRGATFKMPSQLVGVDPRIDAVVQKAMDSEREDRYQSTAQIKEALAQIAATLQDLPTPVMPVILEPETARPSTVTRPVTVGRPATTGRPATAGRPATVARGVSQPVVRPGSGTLSGVRVSSAAAEVERAGKKPNLLIPGAIAVVAVMIAALFLLRKPAEVSAPPPPPAIASASTPATTTTPASTAPAPVVSEKREDMKSAPAPAAPTPGQWTKVDLATVKSTKGRMEGDKLILPTDSHAYPQLPEMLNAFIRVKIRREDDVPRGMQLKLRAKGTSIYAFAAVPSAGSPQGMLQVSRSGTGESRRGRANACDSLAPGKESTYEFGAVGDQFIFIIDGKTIVTYQDDRLQMPGTVIFSAGRGQVEYRDFEVLPLDGLSEDKYPEFVKDALAQARAASPDLAQGSPAMKTSDGAATPPGSFPPGSWVKPIRKWEDVAEVHRKGGQVKWEDGWLKPTDAAKGFGFTIPEFKGANMAIRVVMRNPGANPSSGPVLQTRITSNAGRYEMMPLEASLAISHLKDANRAYLAKGARRIFITPDRDIRIELAVIGTQFYGRADDGLVVRATDSRLASGGIGLHSKSWIRDIEVMNLDGVPEAEALRLAGVDEKGNDLRLPDSEKFVPGQWTKVFTQAEQLPHDVRLPTSGVTWDDGWIRYEKAARLYLPSSLVGNYGVRARFERVSTKSTATVTLRNQSLTKVEHYKLSNSGGSKFACDATNGNETVPIFVSAPRPPVMSETEYTMEFGVVGNRLVGRLNGTLVQMASDDRFKTGYAYFTGSESTRDIEVISLDGLPEAEALRLLGVDEAGNDVRPQELQRMAQIRLSEAIAAIPEVKQLHDQFLALQSERVTAPFEADLAKLNAGYLGGLERALSDAKIAGRANDVAALEAEKNLIAGRQPLPPQDDEGTPDTVKKLRGIYRDSRAPLDARREASLKALTGPLQNRLAALATDFTGKGRDADAKVVQEFMAQLSAGDAVPASAPASSAASTTVTIEPAGNAATPASEAPARTFAPADPLKAAEWVFSLGGTLDIEERGARRTIRKHDELPNGRFDIVKVWLDKARAIAPTAKFTTLEPIAGLRKLAVLETHYHDVPDSDTDVLASLPALKAVHINDAKKFTGERLGLLRGLPDLEMVHFSASGITPAGVQALAALKRLPRLDLSNTPLLDDDLEPLSGMRDLRTLYLRSSLFSAAALQHFKNQAGVVEFGWKFRPGSAVEEGKVIAELFPRLTTFAMDLGLAPSGSEVAAVLASNPGVTKVLLSGGSMITDEIGLALAASPPLVEILFTSTDALTDATLEALAAHKSMKILRFDTIPGISRSGLMALTRLRTLASLDIGPNAQINDAALAEFGKQRPDVKVTR